MELIIKMIIALVLYDILGWGLVLFLSLLSWKRWNPKMDNPPPPPPRKSFKERLAEKQGLYQPTDKANTSNPPKETGT